MSVSDQLIFEYIPTKGGGHTTVLFHIVKRRIWPFKHIVDQFGDNLDLATDEAREEILYSLKVNRFKLL